mmetsp:Transcript_27110/g.72793  ORF Transcript_27110/g.72793 Transcript_27110/m.72793 type:complete len:192 (-) Transcript_27110:189-764(-)
MWSHADGTGNGRWLSSLARLLKSAQQLQIIFDAPFPLKWLVAASFGATIHLGALTREAGAHATRGPLSIGFGLQLTSHWFDRTSLKYMPSGSSRSSSWVPLSTTAPSWITAIESALRIVESRCAIVTVVRFCFAMISSSAACTMRSDSLSSADVASSSSSTDGLRTIARAIATRCFCPPDSLPPRIPTSVL